MYRLQATRDIARHGTMYQWANLSAHPHIMHACLRAMSARLAQARPMMTCIALVYLLPSALARGNINRDLFSGYIRMYVRTYVRSVICAGAYE